MAGPACRRCSRPSRASGATTGNGSPATLPRSRTRLPGLATPARPEALSPTFVAETAQRLAQAFDTIHGGFAGAPKFPQAPVLHLLWRQALATGDPAYAPGRPAYARQHLPGWHLRSPGRRLRTLFGRCAVAGAALREDALRQCPADRAVVRRCGGHRQSAVRGARCRDGRLARAGDAGRRRVRLQPRCRQRGRGGQVLRLGCGRDRPAARPRRRRLPAGLRRHRWRQLGRQDDPQSSAPGGPRRARRRRRRCARAPSVLLAARARRVPARARRQGAGRLERPDDRGAGPGERGVCAGRSGWSARRRRSPSCAARWPAATGSRTAGARGDASIWRFSTTMRRWRPRRSPCSSTRPEPDYLQRAREWVARLDADYLDPAGGYFQVAGRRQRRAGAPEERPGRTHARRPTARWSRCSHVCTR